jgi:predicted ArsR family transcriptional regulator
MTSTKLGARFFESTRGRIVALLRGTSGTVSELAAKLGLTDNAIRAHMATLERDGLVRQQGTQKATRKPHFAYELTAEAEHLFPKPYDMLLNQFIAVIKQSLPSDVIRETMATVGRALAGQLRMNGRGDSFMERLQSAVKALEALGGAFRIEHEERGVFIRSNRCPLQAVVCEHPDICQMVGTLVAEIVEAPVHEHCQHGDSPRCSFELPVVI